MHVYIYKLASLNLCAYLLIFPLNSRFDPFPVSVAVPPILAEYTTPNMSSLVY